MTSPGIVWVRQCPRCEQLDFRRWFATAEEGGKRTEAWSCPACGFAGTPLLEVGEFDDLYGSS